MPEKLKAILMHPAVRPLGNGQKGDPSTGLGCIALVRRAWRDAKQALANARDEADPGGWPNNGWTADMGDAAKMGCAPGDRRLREALRHNDLPCDLRAMIESYLKGGRSDAN